MSVAALPEDKHDTVSLLPPAAQYKLAAASTPPEVLARVEAGDLEPSRAAAVVVERVTELRAAEREQSKTPEERKKEAERRTRQALENEREAEHRRATQQGQEMMAPYRRMQSALLMEMLASKFDAGELRKLASLMDQSGEDVLRLTRGHLMLSTKSARPRDYPAPQTISVDLIFPTRLTQRPVERAVARIEYEMQQGYAIPPILVRPARRVLNGAEIECFDLVKGRQRLEAIKRKGWTHIDAFII